MTGEVTEGVEESVEDEEAESVDEMRATLEESFDRHDEPKEKEEVVTDATIAPVEEQEIGSEVEEPKRGSEGQEDRVAEHEAKVEKAPVGWKADAREEWEKLPENVRKQVAERERDIAMTMQNTSEARKVAKTFSDTMIPFQESLEGMGYNDPFVAVKDIMGHASKMASGTSQQRAVAAANVLKAFQIDIASLDDALVSAAGGTPATRDATDTSQLEALLDQRLQPMQQFMQQQSQQQQSAAGNEVQQFMQDQEFAADVRMDMADLLDIAAQRQQPMTMKQAYDKACMMNDSVSKVVIERQRSERAAKAGEVAKSKRLAASSISGTRSGGGSPRVNDTIESSLNDAWDMHTGQTGRI